MKLINKAALIAEIEKCYNECLKRAKITDSDYWNAKAEAYRNVLVILNDTLETKEVDLEKEIQNIIHKRFHDYYGIVNSENGEFANVSDMVDIAKKFYELGLKKK